MKKTFLVILLISMTAAAFAQKASVAVGCRPDNLGKLVVQIKFLFPDKIISGYSVNIFRKAASSANWEKITAKPIVKASLSESYTDEDYKNYVSFMKRKPAANAEDENNALAIVGIMILDNNNLARYAGCYYEDVTAIAGETYQYRLTDAAGGDKEIAVSASFLVKENYLPLVDKVTLTQKLQNVNINWERGSAFLAYNIYRKTTPEGKGNRINEDGIIPGKASGKDVKNIDDIKFIDTALPAGTTVYYELTGIDVLGNESRPSAAVEIEIRDMIAPDVVKNLKPAKENGYAVLKWKGAKNKDLKGYNIYRNSHADTAYKKVNSLLLAATIESYTDKSVNEGDAYGYIVESVDEVGNVARSRPVKVFFPDKTPPGKPMGLKAVTKPGVVLLTWDINKEADLKGYYIYRANNRDKEYFSMLYKEPITQNSFIDTLPGLAKNEFVYYVQAVDKSYNTGEPSDTVIAVLPDTTAPGAPFIRSIYFNGRDVALEWLVKDNDATSFDVFRSEDSAASLAYRKINTAPVRERKYVDPISRKGQAYYYYVVARDNAGNLSSKSDKRSVFIEADTTATIAAQNLKAEYSIRDSSVSVSWMSAATDIRGYIVYRKEPEGDRFSAVSPVISRDSFTDKTVEYGVKYVYKVRSFYKNSDMFSDSGEIEIK